MNHHKNEENGVQFTDVETLRERARHNVEKGAVTDHYGADRKQVIEKLNESLATELVCVRRYKRHYDMASGLASESVKAEFLAHAGEEQGHADRLAERIVQLGGAPDLNPSSLSARAHSEYVEGSTLREMIREDLVAERIAIESYVELVGWLDGKDPTSQKLLREILANEEEHAEELASLLAVMK